MKTVLIRPTTSARRATRRTALAAALLLASSTLAVSVPQQADAVGPQACTDAFPTAAAAPKLVNGVYEIASEANLVFLSGAGSNAFVDGSSEPRWREQDFVQKRNLDLEGCLFISIGRNPGGGTFAFTGTYDGGGHTISGLRINEPTVDFVGLFAGVSGATLSDIHLFAPNVTGQEYVGGLVGEIDDRSDSEATGPTLVRNSTISNGRVESTSDQVGGLIGLISVDGPGQGRVDDSHFSGAVVNDSPGSYGTGGLVGENGGEITNSSASGTVTSAGNFVGGLAGDHYGTITDSWSTAEVRGVNRVGGLAGGGGSITGSHATGDVTGTGEGVGGLVGKLFSGDTITDSYATGDVVGEDRVGGLVGDNSGGSIVASFSTSDVDGTNAVGGLIGDHYNSGTITDSYATGDVSGTNEVGGLIGANEADVTNAFAVGAVGLVAGGTRSGGLIGDEDDGAITASFWDVETTGIVDDDSSGATGRTTAEMTSFATFDAAWNTGSTPVIVEGWQAPSNPTWGICAAVNGGYPFLLWQFDTDPCFSALTSPATVASTPVLIGGVAPEVPAGQGVWQQADGTSTPLVVSSPAANQLRYEADGVRVTLTGTAASSPARGLVADPAGEIVCEVCVPASSGQVIEVWMFSTPRLVAAHRVDDTECHLFAIPLSAPLDGQGPVSAGAHTLQLAIPTSSGMQAVNVGVTVGGLVPSSVPAGEGPVPFGAVLIALFAAAGVVVAGRRLVTAG